MAIVKPFKALRPPQDKAEQVACVPYDVVSDDEVREITAKNPSSFLRVTRPRGRVRHRRPRTRIRESKNTP